MSYVEKNLIPGESISYQTRLHWIVLVPPAIVGIFFGVPGLGMVIGAIASIGDKSGDSGIMVGVGLAFLVLAAALFGFGMLRRNSTEMAVTNKRVLIKIGLISRTTVEVLLSKVESIGVIESMLGRMLGYGTVTVRGTGGTPEPFDKIAHPLEFRRQVQQQIETLQSLVRNAAASEN